MNQVSTLDPMNRNGGFTLVELMVTLAVAVILATVAIPNFRLMVQDNRTVTQTNELVSALNLARSEAIKRGDRIMVSAQGGNFINGWCVHTGTACNDTTRLRAYSAMNGMVATESSQTVTFNGRGEKAAPAANVVITLSPSGCPSGATSRARRIEVGGAGRVNVQRVNCPAG